MLSEEFRLALEQRWRPQQDDFAYLQKFQVDKPSYNSPIMRHLERALFQARLKLYHSQCALSGKKLLSMYPPEKGFTVYSREQWWSDRWDALNYAQSYNFENSFFTQFDSLYRRVPKYNIYGENTENCDYSISTVRAKNCYYCISVFASENAYYCEECNRKCENICDCLRVSGCSWLYDSVLCVNCHESISLFQCENTHSSYYCIDCVGCSDCLFCSNLRHKSYCIENRQVSPEEFKRFKRRFVNASYSSRRNCLDKLEELWQQAIWPATVMNNCEGCIGDVLRNCKDCYECYNSNDLNHCRYCWDLIPATSASYCFDVTRAGIAELVYNSCGIGGKCYDLRMCVRCRDCSGLAYCIDCYHCNDCFGCTGLTHKAYCILNKQYDKKTYQELVIRIVSQMRQHGEWGGFFPPLMSPFAYNDSMASIYVSLEKEEAQRYKFPWREEDSTEIKAAPVSIPDALADFDDSFRNTPLNCSRSGRAYRITKAELEFYQKMSLPVPRLHPELRVKERRGRLRDKLMRERLCNKTGAKIKTTLPPESRLIVYSNKAYVASLY